MNATKNTRISHAYNYKLSDVNCFVMSKKKNPIISLKSDFKDTLSTKAIK